MVLIPVYNVYHLRLQASLPQTPTHEKMVDGHVSSIYFNFVMLVAAQLLSGCGFGPQHVPNYLDHCLDTLSDYGSGREPCTAKVFSPRLGVLSGFVFQRRSPGDTTPSERGQSDSVP